MLLPAERPSPPLLVVEDDPDLLELACSMLRSSGHKVVGATSAEQALVLVDGRPIAGLFCDLMLPGASGLELAARLRADRPQLPVLLTSGQRTAEVRDAVEASGLPFLPKPYTAGAVRDAVAAALDPEGGP